MHPEFKERNQACLQGDEEQVSGHKDEEEGLSWQLQNVQTRELCDD
ncbi:hypothetical protein PghCCS26_37980 [Paenibacillus glycanilyticus]|uniref:Uncharacterized protein n=1 Tax=Paenibacillus glycanilyticus TaxID=126569 RepID=A0ABQ6NQ44_9BACL|nr:hypothetical protein PghCCS26_37980 [Paenibacillus glycanilyticus]